MARINGSAVFMAGGTGMWSAAFSDAWIYSWQTGIWSGVPTMIVGEGFPISRI